MIRLALVKAEFRRRVVSKSVFDTHAFVCAVFSARSWLDAGLVFEPHVILIEHDDEALNAFDFVEALRSTGCKVPVIVTRVLQTREFVVRALDTGANDCIPDPVAIDEM